ncbi:MAG: FkbM family methyltransferase [bacterium]|nr:FkbM family methyltransferase [bacterium]MDE0415459.1 FkbM family methyltransferase [bacterium]
MIDQTDEFGRYAPSPVVDWLYGVMNRIYKQGYVGRRAFGRLYWLERLFAARQRTVVDVQRFGLHWRLHRFGNVSESRLLRRPDSFEAEEIAFILDLAVGNFIFIDVGANCGYWSLRIAKKLAGKGSVIAIEPQPVMLERLQFNARINALHLNHILGCTVGIQSGTAMLKLDERNLGRSRVSDTGSLCVEMRTLLEIVEWAALNHVDAIKVDVEGHEDRVLEPFLRNAVDALLPKVIVAECSWSASWEDDWLTCARERGYREIKRTRHHNVILVREG